MTIDYGSSAAPTRQWTVDAQGRWINTFCQRCGGYQSMPVTTFRYKSSAWIDNGDRKLNLCPLCLAKVVTVIENYYSEELG